MTKRICSILLVLVVMISCTSTKSTIKNIDDTAVKPAVKDNAFQIKQYADDDKYGFDQDYPINIGFIMESSEEKFIGYFFKGLQGPEGETLTYKKVESCCPFPTKNNKVGVGMLSIYEVRWPGVRKPLILYFNIYERGRILCPKGLTIKNYAATKP
ncbi:hypothetical protein [Flavobacterium suncheonense]|uniref:2-dehydro-3-deoxyphosphooctonate aldolase n=1 Tax=Flavobacterium suncheonense GH29-5 = DSM 17707 TaxID=1121899 RepID=A0A0A2M8K1_9FLAO|nr:hypothetical protein [Flavobacterium suncheonense]KGO89007.1 2-dehydro-3-deoxyphosphooctonate aldolase [Flavobacterium suncheonense GH29-5 = DSM 17707]